MQELIKDIFPRKRIPHLENNQFIYGEPFKFKGRSKSYKLGERFEFESDSSFMRRESTPTKKRSRLQPSNSGSFPLNFCGLKTYEVVTILQIVEDHIQECPSLKKKIKNIRL